MEENSTTEGFFSETTGKIISISGLIVIAISILIYLIFGSWEYKWILDEAIIGQFGDFIGGFIGSLFSLAGVILFYVALKEQRKDISINQRNIELQTSALEQQVTEFQDQKTELVETRKVYEEQTILIREQTNLYRQQNRELKEQSNTAKVQQFDSSFFSYLNILNEYKYQLNQQSTTNNYFGEIYQTLKDRHIDESEIEIMLKNVCEHYLEIFNDHRDRLSPYYKTLYRVMVLIDSSNIDDYRKWEYFKLLRSQLSDVELLLLNYNYHTNYGLKVRSLIIKYNFLKHINIFDKIEFNFIMSSRIKRELESFLKHIELVISESIKEFKSIENEEDITKSFSKQFLELLVEVKLIISDEFVFSVIFNNNELSNNDDLNNEMIKSIFRKHLYSILYMSKYAEKSENDIHFSTIITDDKTEFVFKINNIDSL